MAKEYDPYQKPESSRDAAPPVDRINRGLTRFLAETGTPPREGFPTGRQLSEYDYRTGQLVLHPWAPPRVRAAVLLDEAVRRCETLEYERRAAAEGAEEDEDGIVWYEGDDAAWRPDLVRRVAARRLGLAHEEPDAATLEAGEEAAVERIVGSVLAPAEGRPACNL